MRRPLAQASAGFPSWALVRCAIAALFACALLLTIAAAQAHAVPKGTVSFFGGSGTGAGQFSTPAGVAVKESTGHVYVVDSGNHRVQEFDPLGTFVRAWGWGVQTGAAAFEVCSAPGPCLAGLSGAGAGQLASPQGIAVDQTSGDVYVTNQGNRRVDKFDASGNFLFAFGWGVDTGAAALQTCTTASTCQAGTSGAGAGQFATTFAGHPAVDPRNGDVVVADSANRRVQRFSSAGAFLFAFGWGVDTNADALETCTTASTCQAGRNGSGAGQFSNNQPVRVAVDAAGSVYTVEAAGIGTGNRRVQKFNAPAGSAGIFAPQHTTGTDGATAPTNVAVDSGSGHVLVAKDRQVLELGGVGELVETHAPGGELPVATGMALDDPTDRIYLTTGADQRVFVLGQVTPPSATIDPTTDIAATSATFNGTVNPNGGSLPTGYHFEYSDDAGVSWTSLPIPDVDVGNGTAPVQVSRAATGLEPNTEYRVRLVARRPFAGGTATSAVTTFTTPAAPPDVSGVAAREITDTTAVLAGLVDPNHSQTTYRFEYGTDTSYGSETPIDSAGSGASWVPAVKTITGLQPNTTYHFRLVATNAAGTTAGADHTFTTDAEAPAPSGRAYEMVSPLDKNGGHVERNLEASLFAYQTGAATTGNIVAFASSVNFGDLESGAVLANANYMARRGAGGWTTEGITPPVGGVIPIGTEHPRVRGLALDVGKSFGLSGALLTPDAERLNGSWGLYMRTSGLPPDQRYTLVSSPPAALANEDDDHDDFEFEASTPDARHVVFDSRRKLLTGAPEDANRHLAVYEWADGTLRLVSVPPDGVSWGPNSDVTAGGGGLSLGAGNLHGEHLLSDDGRRVFFTATPAGFQRNLWVREDGERTIQVSASERPGENPLLGSSQEFWAAERTGGSVAFFTSLSPLTQDAEIEPGHGPMLYRWDAEAPVGQRLTALSHDPLDRPAVMGNTAVSDDATTVYFVARGALAPGATRDQPNLFVWRQGQGVRFIGTLAGDDASAGGGLDSMLWRMAHRRTGGRAGRTSMDGDRLLFASYAQLDPAYDTTEESAEACGDPQVAGERCRQIYLYDATAHEISCLTCVAGVPVTSDADLFGDDDSRSPERNVDAPLTLPRNLSADGRRAFFETARPLVTADRNEAVDVYEWADPDLDGEGELRLISPGRGQTDSQFLDASLMGDDVFFTTRERLVGIDIDDQVDLYDARVGGGFAEQNPSPAPPPCEGEGCQGTVSGSPFLAGIGSGGGSNGDASPGPRPSFTVARLTSAQRAKLARGRAVMVRVRVNRAGRVRLTARARLRGRMRALATASKVARKAGSVKLRLKLPRSARNELARRRSLTVKLDVKFAGVREAKSSTVRLRRPRPSGEGSGR